MMTTLKQHELKAELIQDEFGPAVMLIQTDDGYCEPQTILVHPRQLRTVCESLGITPTGDDQADKTIARMARRLLVLNERIAELRQYMAQFSDHEHADLSKEMTKIDAIALLSEEWAADVGDYWQGGHQASVETPVATATSFDPASDPAANGLFRQLEL